MDTEIYPLTLETFITERVWEFKNAWLNDRLPLGFEGPAPLWLAAETSRVASGPQAGRTVGYLMHLWGARLGGDFYINNPNQPLPLELSVKRAGESTPLVEVLTCDSLWQVLETGEESYVHAGYVKNIDMAALAEKFVADPLDWQQFMPRFELEKGMTMFLPKGAPIILSPGMIMGQIAPPSPVCPVWPFNPDNRQSLDLAGQSTEARILSPRPLADGSDLIYQDASLSVRLVRTSSFSSLSSTSGITFLWPISGQGRIRVHGPAPSTRLSCGNVVMLPACLGHYGVESNRSAEFLIIETY